MSIRKWLSMSSQGRFYIATVQWLKMSFSRCAFGIDSNSYKDPENKLLVYGRQVFDEFILRDVATTLLWHVYMMIGPMLEKCVDIMPEHYR